MSTPESMLPAEARLGSPFAEAPPSRWDAIDAKLSWLTEYIGPILGKDTRQALKSRQFVITFSLLLIAGWGWSLLVVANSMPGIYYAPRGAFMLAGYFCVLCFPLLVIVPFSAYRSLSGECEDGTFELVSITSLSPRQIVGGKLGSAIVQMLMYLSALAPAMAFTYMLGGIQICLILLCVLYFFFISVALSIIGLLFATISNSRTWLTVIGLKFILELIAIFFLIISGGLAAIQAGAMPYDEPHFWAAQLFIVTIVASYAALFYLSAMARLTFVSDNRSTKIRVCLFVIQVLAISWATWYWLMENQYEILIAFLVWAGFHWWLMGGLMIGESGEISPRIRRDLPETFIGRAFSIWLYPGPGTGYVFTATCYGAMVAMVCAAAFGASFTTSLTDTASAVSGSPIWKVVFIVGVVLLCALGGLLIYRWRNQPTAIALIASLAFALTAGISLLFLLAMLVPPSSDLDHEVVSVAIFIYCYLLIYLGITRLAMMLMERFVQGGIFLSALLSILFVACGAMLHLLVTGFSNSWEMLRNYDLTVFQVTNPFWTVAAIESNDLTIVNVLGASLSVEGTILVITAAGMLLLNLALAAREVDRAREAVPDRVLEEERALHPEKIETAKPSSPWDE